MLLFFGAEKKNRLNLVIADVRTHPPLQYTFPPAPARKKTRDRRASSDNENDSDSDSDDAKDAIIPGGERRRSRGSTQSSIQHSQNEDHVAPQVEERFVSINELLHHASPYISLDDSRMGFSPALKLEFQAEAVSASRAAAIATARRKSRLPNTTLNIDLRTLNLHLALRAAEILACSESMWEWVVEYQERVEAQRKEREKEKERVIQATKRNRSGSLEVAQQPQPSQSPLLGLGFSNMNGNTTDPVRRNILDLTREDFDGLLNKFDM